ncbi:MAG: nitronate monooxygenase [Bacteroidales bacterium]|nr:nitronate monooxygenase [Bacteroidales bacterium]MDD3700127.1 nitronate monooxygenase [Bacteroidales bacterium]MDY0369049.1 nitronate monooxygenase [Bacteroidales bacterium]
MALHNMNTQEHSLFFKQNRLCNLLDIQIPVIQAGMIWCSGWKLAAAVSNTGGLGIIGAGSMYPDVLKTHIAHIKQATTKPYGVNLPLFYPDIDAHIETIIHEKVPLVITSAGNPTLYTQRFKKHGIKVMHVIANRKFALKALEAGVDALIAEGVEAGGHNGFEETTTLTLIPLIRQITDIPLIAAGGIATGSQMLAAIAMGADGVQMGTAFVTAEESSAHDNFKQMIINSAEGDTELRLKKLIPVRLLKNHFYELVRQAEENAASVEELKALLGRGRAKKGMFEGDLIEGELEIGQAAALINEIKPASIIIHQLINEYITSYQNLIQQHTN